MQVLLHIKLIILRWCIAMSDKQQEAGADLNAEQAIADGGGVTPVKPRKRKKFVIILVISSLSICGGVSAFLLKKKSESAETSKLEAEETKKQTVFYDMDEIIVNLNTSGKGVSFLKLRLALELDDTKDVKILEELMPKVQDTLQLYLRELRPTDLQGSVGLYRLREEMLLRINKIIYPAQVSDVLFKDVLVQ